VNDVYVSYLYIVSITLFVLSLRWLGSVGSSRWGNWSGVLGMSLAVVATLVALDHNRYDLLIVAVLVGAVIGAPLALFMPMTAVPQRTALSHAFGSVAAALVGTAEYLQREPDLDTFTMSVLAAEMILGFLTFTGSIVAFGKLQEIIPGRPILYKGRNVISLTVLAVAVGLGVALAIFPSTTALLPMLIVTALLFGVLLVIGIGGADMPTVIAILNSYAGLSASALGFVLNNKILVVAGALDGSSGFILALLMSKAMNRSFVNILFGGVGAVAPSKAKDDDVYGGKVKSATPDEVAAILEVAQRVVIVPGYGMSVARAQHGVRDLTNYLEALGKKVLFGIHPVAGRMPGHMNVLLAEADIPYDRLKDMDEINPLFKETDVVLVIGANDVVNPMARSADPSVPVAGMPILNVDEARIVVVIKRSLSPGFAGIPNPLFAADNCLMLFGDAKAMTLALVTALKEIAPVRR